MMNVKETNRMFMSDIYRQMLKNNPTVEVENLEHNVYNISMNSVIYDYILSPGRVIKNYLVRPYQ